MLEDADGVGDLDDGDGLGPCSAGDFGQGGVDVDVASVSLGVDLGDLIQTRE